MDYVDYFSKVGFVWECFDRIVRVMLILCLNITREYKVVRMLDPIPKKEELMKLSQ